MVIALFGYRGSGKTSLFEILSGKKKETHSGGHETRLEISRAIFSVPDARLEKLADLYPDKKKTLVHLEIEDFPGLAAGEVSTSHYLAELRKVDGLVQVIRAFKNPAVAPARGQINPVSDLEAMAEELILSDLILVSSRLEKLEKELKKMKDPEAQKEKELLDKLKPLLEQGRPIKELNLTSSEEKRLRCFCFLSLKPKLSILNLDEDDLAFLDSPEQLYLSWPADQPILAFCGKIERELMDLEEEDRQIFQSTYGLLEMTPVRFVRKVFEVMGLINFYTIGKEEVRAWVVKKGTPAVKAAGEIHSDIEKGFIRAEVIPLEEVLKYGSWQKAKEAGSFRLEGKDYPVQDGDVIYFRFSQ